MCTAISHCTHPCDTNTFTHRLKRIYLLQPKIHNIWNFLKSKNFPLKHKKIPTLKTYIKFILIKLSSDIFLLDHLSKAKRFWNFLAGISVLLFNTFRNVRFSDRYHFIVTVFLLEKSQCSYFLFFCFTT